MSETSPNEIIYKDSFSEWNETVLCYTFGLITQKFTVVTPDNGFDILYLEFDTIYRFKVHQKHQQYLYPKSSGMKSNSGKTSMLVLKNVSEIDIPWEKYSPNTI